MSLQQTFQSWRRTDFKARSTALRAIADALEARAEEFAQLMNREMGKLPSEGKAEIEKCAWVCRYYAEHGEAFLAPSSHVMYEPLGVILAIMPWNYPFWQVFRVAAPNMMAGNVVMLKHAQVVRGCGQAIESLFDGQLESKEITHDEVEALIADPLIKGVTLTGSQKAGRHVAQLAAKYLKPCVLELGGSDPFIVFDDADVKHAAVIAAKSRCLNSGQSCIAAKRFIVHEKVFTEFVSQFHDAMAKLPMAPLVSEAQHAELNAQIADAVAKGATRVGGHILTNISRDMRVWCEETFGVVAPVVKFDDDDEALMLANDTEYGLGASIWTHDETRISRFVRELECGMVFVNAMVKSDPRVPFGGIKNSGFGRELGREGILSFVNVKTVWRNDP